MIPTLYTERLLLRAPCSEDFPVYRAFFADAEASSFYGGPLETHQAWRILASDIGHWQLRGYGRWAIERRDNGEMIGGCGLWWPEGCPRSELTWWLTPSGRGRGFATEASLAVISYAHNALSWKKVTTHMDDDNTAARRLVHRLGGDIIARETFPDGQDRNVFLLPPPLTD